MNPRIPTSEKKPASPPPCKRWSYHVFAFGANHCSCCGWDRYATTSAGAGAVVESPQP